MFNNIQSHFESASTEPELEGLKFIEADHPYIRVHDSLVTLSRTNLEQYVGRWTTTADKSRKDASFPGNEVQATSRNEKFNNASRSLFRSCA
jgi:hypothetical protein